MLHVHRAERADALADALAEILAHALEDPFATEVVAVPTRGMERWLTQRMSTRLGASGGRTDGICANVGFPFPGVLVREALASATGVDPDSDPWAPERLVWPLLETVDGSLHESWLNELATHLGTDSHAAGDRAPRRFATVRHIADLYEHYATRRPSMVQAWARSEEPVRTWQAELWRRLREHIGMPSPAERLDPATARLIREPALVELPRRIALFGLTRLPASHLQVLAALADAREVNLFILHPSPALWEQIATGEAPLGQRRRPDQTAAAASNRLLASWGQDSRELQLVLRAGNEHEDHHHPVEGASNTLLQGIQADIRNDRSPPGPALPDRPDERARLDPADRSVQIHACHGRARQVEVVRDAILHLLEEDSTLEPRDVIVMCPDIETMAPLIQASFGAGRIDDDEDGEPDEQRRLPDLRVRLADRSLRQTNPVLGVVSVLLELADKRMTASQLLDLADREPVRRRFRFDDDDITRMEEWVAASGIRWGLDEEHRKPFKLDVVGANTWRSGLDRILIGVAMTEEDRRMVGGVLPLDDVESGAIDLAGRLAEFVDRVHHCVDQLTPAQAIDSWATSIAAAADALTATSDRDGWQRMELQRILDDIRTESHHEPEQETSIRLELADIRALLADRLRGRPTRANFRTGHLTICTLVPMRSVPHRVICLVGLDDGEFPRKAPRDGDDLLLEDPHVGDRDPRAEDRQLLLDAVLAATERLIITYTGNDERTNLIRPPAVPVAELLDIVDRTVRSDAAPPRDRILVRHPLQPFDPRNFIDGALAPRSAWSFDQVALGGARALAGPRAAREPFLRDPLPAQATDLIELDSLVRFVEHPVRAFLRGRLGISVRESLDEVRDALPVELDSLEEWGVGQRLLEGLLSGAEIEECVNAEEARGSLPPAMLAATILGRVRPVVQRIAVEADQHGRGPSVSLDVNLRLADGRRLAGTIPGVRGHTIRRVSYSRVRPKDRIGAWVRLLALSAARPEHAFESVVIGRARPQARSCTTTLAKVAALGGDAGGRKRLADHHLSVLIDLYDRGMREFLPIGCQASAAYAEAAFDGEDREAAAREAWESRFRFDKEDRDPEHLLVHGRQVPVAELLNQEPRPDERGEGWAGDERGRFGLYARTLWDGLLSVEALKDR